MERIRENKAGKWVYLPQKYTAFIPNMLPIKALNLSSEVLTQLEATKAALTEFNKQEFLNAASKQFTGIFLKTFLLKEAIYSSKIESIETSPEALLAADLTTNTEPCLTNDVYNNYLALREAFTLAEKLPLVQRFFRKTQETLLRNPNKRYCTPGEFRRTQNWIGQGEASLDKALFVPPPAGELASLLANLEAHINRTEEGEELLIKAAIIHVQFEMLHPFLDGNGRVGRIINAIFLKNNNLCDTRFLVFSATLYKNLEAYYENFQRVQNLGDWEAWFLFYLKMVQAAAKNSEDILFCLAKIYDLSEIRINQLFKEEGKQAALNLHKRFAEEIVVEYTPEDRKNIKTKYLLIKFQEYGIIKKIGEGIYKYREIFEVLFT